MDIDKVKRLAKEILNSIRTKDSDRCKKPEIELEDCGTSGQLIFEFYEDCSPEIDEEVIKKIVDDIGLAYVGREITDTYMKIHIAEKGMCKLQRVSLSEEIEFEIPTVNSKEQLDKILDKYDKLVIIVGKRGCKFYEEVLPNILSVAIRISLDPLPIFVIEDHKEFEDYLNKWKVDVCPTALRIENGKVVNRIEGVVDLDDKKKAVKETIKMYRKLIEE